LQQLNTNIAGKLSTAHTNVTQRCFPKSTSMDLLESVSRLMCHKLSPDTLIAFGVVCHSSNILDRRFNFVAVLIYRLMVLFCRIRMPLNWWLLIWTKNTNKDWADAPF